MSGELGSELRRPVALTAAGLAVIGWLLAATLWSQSNRLASQMADSSRAAEQARQTLAADLQNLRNAVGDAAEVKLQVSQAGKALADATAARAAAERDLAGLEKKIGEAKLALATAQESAQEAANASALERKQAEAELASAVEALAQKRKEVASADAELKARQADIASARSELKGLQERAGTASPAPAPNN